MIQMTRRSCTPARRAVLLGAALFCMLIPEALTAEDALPLLYVRAGVLIDGTGADPQRDMAILVRGERIERVGPASEMRRPDAAQLIDLSDRTVLPGLIDSHDHLTGELQAGWEWSGVTETPADAAIAGTVYALRTLRAGFTTVRNVGDSGGESHALRRAIEEGLIEGPRIFTARQALSITGGHGDGGNGFRPDLRIAGQTPVEAGVCNSPDDCRAAVRHQVKYGADLIKISATGGVLSPGDELGARQFSDRELEAIMTEAHALGRKVAAHAHGTAGIKAAVLAGVDSIDHGSILDDDAIRLMKKHGTYLVPTLMAGETVYSRARDGRMPEFARDKALEVYPLMQDSFRKAIAAGVKIAFGTDSGVSPHGDNAHEFELMVEAGMTPMDTIVSATRTAAELLGHDGDLGTIEQGKYADLVAFDGDPLRDITVLKRPVAVIKSGRLIDLGRRPEQRAAR
jgi:imidazolonepropionase-like amidohydrolase